LKALVTGGAGFIGSHVVDYLINNGKSVKVIDNLSSGKKENLSFWENDSRLEFYKADLLDKSSINEIIDNCNEVYHFAANPEVNIKNASPEDHFRQNIEATYNLLEVMRESKQQKFIAFTSSSTVYGEAEQIPTIENYGPLVPISLYGASKLACEALLSAYASMYGFKAMIFRLANVVGSRSNHGIIYDFINKLRKNTSKLEILGDGTQSKSYLHVDDFVSGLMQGIKGEKVVNIFNIGSIDRTNVLTIAEIIKEEMDLRNVENVLTGGLDGGRGWLGDVKIMQLDTNKLKNSGWSPKYTSAAAVRHTAKAILNEIN
jgi:UDP-glucose 4-epimerase